MLRLILDGSGKSNDPNNRFLTLAGVIATNETWDEWETRWRLVLDKFSVQRSHMRRLLQKDGPFSTWDENHKINFCTDLFDTVVNSDGDRMRMIFSSATVDLDAYRSIPAYSPKKPAEAICVDYVSTTLFNHKEFLRQETEILFDVNESFLKYIDYTYRRNRKSPDLWGRYLSDVRKVKPNEIGVELADLIAWPANRHYSNDRDESYWRDLMYYSFSVTAHFHNLVRAEELLAHPGFYGWPTGIADPSTEREDNR